MPQKKVRVIVTRRLPDVIETRMMELFDCRLNREDRPMSQAQLIEAVKGAEVLVPTVNDRIDSAVLSQAGPQLKLIASFGTGVDHIDLKTARQRGATVTNTPGVLTEDTADMTMALILSVPRRLAEGERVVRSGDWQGWAPTGMLGHRVNGKRLGIIGMGRIGSAVARRAKGFNMSIHYHNRRRVHPALEEELEATYWESLDQMLSRMDIISVNCPHTPATFHLLSARRLKLLREDAYIVNTPRGEVVDENARARRRPPPYGLPRCDPIPQPAPGAPCGGGGSGGDLLGEPRPDALPHGHHLGQLPAYAGNLPPALRAPPQAAARGRLHREHLARRGGRRERPGARAGGRRDRRRRPRRLRAGAGDQPQAPAARSEEHTSELQSLMRISYAVFCLKKKTMQH